MTNQTKSLKREQLIHDLSYNAINSIALSLKLVNVAINTPIEMHKQGISPLAIITQDSSRDTCFKFSKWRLEAR